ncbi:bifunctional diguanylate cyclase/phosphodiesterase [Deefgea salmonis]|uniref:EAL domain-containing protein n=1 Tax=Deefgea salmonis TaxID=2875502 RepID=A0ABS8BLG8_9NEIS|nr:EAL domain-containing protein [Deefgea salmonis]MCB5196454.1 EAL domain-containing protein [Deefgea salmonis]
MSFTFAALLILALLLSSWLQFQNQNKAIENLAEKIMAEQANEVRHQLLDFLAIPILNNQILNNLFEIQTINEKTDLSKLNQPFINTYTHVLGNKPALSLIGFGSASGQFIALLRDQQITRLLLKDQRTQNQLQLYPQAEIGAESQIIPGYDPRDRPWYQAAIHSGQASWSDVYATFDQAQSATLSYSSPVYNQVNQLIGVLMSDINIDHFNQFLLEQTLLGHGAIFIVDQQQRLVTHSSPRSVMTTMHNQPAQRTLAKDSEQAQIRAASALLNQGANLKTHFQLRGERIYFQSISLNNQPGIDWRIIILIPEKDLIGNLKQNQRNTVLVILLIGLAVAMLAWWLLGRITRPIISTTLAAEKLGHADWQAIPSSGIQLKETALLTKTFNEMAGKLALSFEQLNQQIRFDSMTGLMNRNGLAVAINDWAYTPSQSQLMLLIGLDGYRAINDSVGHALGDALLQSISVRLLEHLPPNALLARTAGAEFTILLPEISSPEEATYTTLRYLAYFSEAFQAEQSADEIVVTASIGAVYERFRRCDLTDWLRNASVALGKAKAKGFGSYTLFEAEMIEQSIAKTRLTSELKLALERQEFRVFFQPVIDLQNGETIGAEALIRWESPRGMISPGVFIPAAEDSGLILQIGNWVLRESCQQIADQLKAGWRDDFDVHVNVSVRQLIQSDFYEQLLFILQTTGLPAHNLTLEITESCLVTQSEVVAKLIRRVRALGVGIAIDDFGTGYSSLAYLHQFDFDYLKIDQSFIARMLENIQDEAIVSAIISMAAGFKVILVGEGVETEAQANRLRELGCQRVQGYFFGRPAPLAAWSEDIIQQKDQQKSKGISFNAFL